MGKKIWLWFWVAMVIFASFLGYTNYVTNHMILFWINVMTVVCAAVNVHFSYQAIKSEEAFLRWLDGGDD